MKRKLDVEKAPAELRGLLAVLDRAAVPGRRRLDGLTLRFEKAADPGLCEARMEGRRGLVRYGTPV
jgi:hypothetical protein